MIIPIILFAVGLVMLIKGGDWFVDGASGIAHRFHIPEILIGATVVSIGTTLPEVMVSATGAMQGSGDMAYGNAIGSIICNTSLIAALTIAIRPSETDKKSLRFPVIFFFGAAVFYSFVSYYFGYFARWIGIVLLLGFVVYMIILALQAKKAIKPTVIDAELVLDAMDDEVSEDNQGKLGDFWGFIIVGIGLIAAQIFTVLNSVQGGVSIDFFSQESNGFFANLVDFVGYYLWGILGVIIIAVGLIKGITKNKISILNSNIVFLILGAFIIAIGADLLVDNGIIIAETLGVPQSVIALTFVALGTSLPEFVTAITALIKGHSSLSLGNIIGANIFNLVLVSGVSITISPFAVPNNTQIWGINSSLLIDIPVMLAVMAIMTIPTLFRGKLSRVQGIALLCIYAAFCVLQFTI